jgi:CRISPR system Cascade subunit CasA
VSLEVALPSDELPRFDLVEASWLDVEWLDPGRGDPAVGLRALFEHAEEIAGLRAGPPPGMSALYRVLYALTARITGLDEAPDGPDEWLDRRDDIAERGIAPGAVDAYFTPERRARFDLFGPRPFLQDARLAHQCAKPAGVNKLVLGRPAGNNHAWFGHHQDLSPYPVSSAEAVMHLLTWLYYGPSGRCSSRTVEGVTAADVRAGPLRSSLSYHPEGRSLLHTLLAGLTPPASDLRRAGDVCPWERETPVDPLGAPQVYRGPCSRLTGGWQHALLLVPDADGRHVTDAYITWGTRHPAPATDDAYLIWQTSKAGNAYPRPADSGRALWRDVDALLLPQATGSAQPRRPRVMDEAAEFPGLRLRALGFEQDGQTRDVQLVSASTPALLDVVAGREPGTARRIGSAREIAERYGRRVEYAVKHAWAGLTDSKLSDCAWAEEAAARYWPAAGTAFWNVLADGRFEQAQGEFRTLAEAVFGEVTDQAPRTCRATAAVERARLELYGGPRAIRRRPDSTRPETTGASRIPQETPMSTPPPTPAGTPAPADGTTEEATTPYTFVAQVRRLCANEPAARAALRSGLRRPVDECRRMHRYIADLVPDGHRGWEAAERACYAVAAMMASVDPAAREEGPPPPRTASGAGENPRPAGAGEDGPAAGSSPGRAPRDLGFCLAEAVARDPQRERTVEDRLDALAKQSVAGLHRHLPAVIDLIADRPHAIDWVRLLNDLRDWGHNRDRVSRRWLQSYYRERQRAVRHAAQDADDSDSSPED